MTSLFPSAPTDALSKLCAFAKDINAKAASLADTDPPAASALQLSLRQLIRLARHVSVTSTAAAVVPDLNLEIRSAVHEAMMAAFQPTNAQDIINRALDQAGIMSAAQLAAAAHAGTPEEQAESHAGAVKRPVPRSRAAPAHRPAMSIEATAARLTIGGVSVTIKPPASPELVPRPLFYDIPQYVLAVQRVCVRFTRSAPGTFDTCMTCLWTP